jgi:hypothetical protein
MIDYMHCSDDNDPEETDPEQPEPPSPQHMLLLSPAAANIDVIGQCTMQLQVEFHGHSFLFLVDFGSSTCFIDQGKAALLTGYQELLFPVPVQVAGGAVLHSVGHFLALEWSADGATFRDTFKVL